MLLSDVSGTSSGWRGVSVDDLLEGSLVVALSAA